MKNELQKISKQAYEFLLADIRSILDAQAKRNEKATNQIKVQTYWLIGERIYREILRYGERAPYGKQIIFMLSKDVGISVSQLNSIIQFYKTYPVVQHLSPELTWSHYFVLISVQDRTSRSFYETQVISNRWSVRELQQRIKDNEYENCCKEKKLPLSPPRRIPQITEIIKNTYDLGFLALSSEYTEQDMEKALINHIGRFLLELGYGFSFVGSQYKIFIGDQIHRIDLLFFHIPLSCYVIVDLKIEKFCDLFVGQMNKYLTYFRERECYPYMKDPIGLIICKEKEINEVHYALGRLSEEIFVADYRLGLPKEEELVQALNQFSALHSDLPPRQSRVIQTLPTDKPFSIHDYQKIAGISLATARRDLKELSEAQKITRSGQGKKTIYRHV